MAKDIQQLFGWTRTFSRTGRPDHRDSHPDRTPEVSSPGIHALDTLPGAAPSSQIGRDESEGLHAGISRLNTEPDTTREPSEEVRPGLTTGALSELTELPQIRQEEFADYPSGLGPIRAPFSTEIVPQGGEEQFEERTSGDRDVEFDRFVSNARASLERQDWEELTQCAEQIRNEYPDRPDGYLMGKAALIELGERDTAEVLLGLAVSQLPGHEQVAIEHAWLAHERRDWSEARKRWEAIKGSFPGRIEGYLGVAIAERESELFDAADASFTETIKRFPENPNALIEFAWVAHNRGDLTGARRRWKELRDRFPDNRYGYLGAGVSERGAGNPAIADALLAEGHIRFPVDEEIAVAYGWIANISQDWGMALARWKSLKQAFPGNEEIGRGLDMARRALERHAASMPEVHSTHDEDESINLPDDLVIENGILVGRNNMLFLAEGRHAVFDFATGRRKVPEQSHTNFFQNLVHRHRAATSCGAKFLHVIFPDKHSVCTEQLPVENPICLGMRYLERFPTLSHAICYPRDELRDAGLAPFMLTDTHMTDHGSIVATAAIVARLVGEKQTEHIDHLLAETSDEVDWTGDLGDKLTPIHSERRINIRMPWVCNRFHNNLTGGNNGIVDILINKESVHDKRVTWFGDSFGRSVCLFLSYFFREVVFLHTPFFHADIFEQILT